MGIEDIEIKKLKDEKEILGERDEEEWEKRIEEMGGGEIVVKEGKEKEIVEEGGEWKIVN